MSMVGRERLVYRSHAQLACPLVTFIDGDADVVWHTLAWSTVAPIPAGLRLGGHRLGEWEASVLHLVVLLA